MEAIARTVNAKIQHVNFQGMLAAISTRAAIDGLSGHHKGSAFYREYLPWSNELCAACVEGFRLFFRLALAHPDLIRENPQKWAYDQIGPLIRFALDEISEWFMLACEGENRCAKKIGTAELIPNQTVSIAIPLTVPEHVSKNEWRAPAWLFAVAAELTGIGLMKDSSVPKNDLDMRLGASHTRLILKGARKVFKQNMHSGIARIYDEEIARYASNSPSPIHFQTVINRNRRRKDEKKEKLLNSVRQILGRNPAMQGRELCAELDRHHAPPLAAWIKSGEWKGTFKSSWLDPNLRKKIRRVRQEAMKNQPIHAQPYSRFESE